MNYTNYPQQLHLNDFQLEARIYAIYPEDSQVIYPALGLAGEAGEVAEKVKKYLRGDNGLDREGIAKELGDVLWYVANLAADLDYNLNEIAWMNIEKLSSRQQRGVIQGSGDNR